jgi:hypothetical protein
MRHLLEESSGTADFGRELGSDSSGHQIWIPADDDIWQ